MKKTIVKFDKAMKLIDADVLREKLLTLKDSELMRSIIINERDYCTCNYERSLRSLWYSSVKPILDKLGKLTNDDMTETSLKSWDKKLSVYMAELVRDGELSYQDIMISDESRKKSVPYFGHYTNIIIAVEKDTIFNLIHDISTLLGCSCISSKGLNSLGATEKLLRQIKSRNKETLTDIYFLVLSDYDPAGYNIAKTFSDQAKELLQVLKMEDCKIHSERIGILPEQLTSEELKNNMYSPKGNIDEWVKITGGINGEAKGLELDALEPKRIRDIFATSLENYIDSNVYEEEIKDDYLKSKIRNVIDPYIDNIISIIAKQKISDVYIKEFDILDLMKAGYRYIPDGKLCTLENDNLNEIASDYFVKQI